MRKLVHILLLTAGLNCRAQFNLVPNGSFESYSSCPNASSQFTYVIGWINPTTSGTPDYYNSCSSNLSVPYCAPTAGVCFQFAKTGNAYAGIACYDKFVTDAREYIQVQLNSTLALGKCYKISFYANLKNYSKIACNKIGTYISQNAISLTGPTYLLNYSPQIIQFNNQIIKDTLNWTLVSGIYQSLGNENFITIGNFFDDANTDTLTINPSVSGGAYYLIDEVSVVPIDSIPGGMSAFAGNDVTINSGDSTFIGQQISNLNCNWYNGTVQIATNTSGLYVKPVTTTTYVVQQTLCGNVTNDTVVVTVLPNGINELEFRNKTRIYPNPSNGIVNITPFGIKEGQLDVSVQDVTGQIIYKGILIVSNGNSNFTLDAKNGIYFVTVIEPKSGSKVISKLVIQN